MLLKQSLAWKTFDLPNRMVLPPMATGKADDRGFLTDETYDYYYARVQGGRIGLIITEHCFIAQAGKASRNQASMAEDGAIPGMAKLAEIIHSAGVKGIVQVNHAGGNASEEVTGCKAMAPSGLRPPRSRVEGTPYAMTLEDIAALRRQFVNAALRAKAAGFDGVEIHAAHSYLLNQFYSPLTNRRCDQYGPQRVENRIRLAVETVRDVREQVGDDFMVAVRLGGCDYMTGGSTEEDCVQACIMLEKAGADLLDLSGGMNGYVIPGRDEPGYFATMTEKVKKHVHVPVILTGGVTEAAQAEALLQAGKADLIGVGRPIYKDAQWAEKQGL